MTLKNILIFLGVGVALWYLFKNPLAEWQARKQTGMQAAADAAAMGGYTTYNTQIYTAPLWAPIVRFFKAGAYVPPQSGGNGSQGSGQSMEYSMQG